MSDELEQPVSSGPNASDEASVGSAAAAPQPVHAAASEVPSAEPPAATATADELPPAAKDWYILKVQSNREDSIRDSLARRVKIEGLDHYFGEILVPTEKVSEFKNGKKRTVKRKLWPGYIVVHMEINDATWHLVRGTPGIGDFVGAAGKPTPLAPQDISKIQVATVEPEAGEQPKLKLNFNKDDRVKIIGGTFENFEGAVESVDMANGRVTVMISIFNRTTPVELDHWEIERL